MSHSQESGLGGRRGKEGCVSVPSKIADRHTHLDFPKGTSKQGIEINKDFFIFEDGGGTVMFSIAPVRGSSQDAAP